MFCTNLEISFHLFMFIWLMTSSHQDGYLLWIKIGNLSICPFLQFVIIWNATECMENWRENNSKLVSFDSKSMSEITSYLVCYSWEPLRIKLGFVFPSKFISKRPYIVLVKPKPKYHGLGVRGLRFDYMVVKGAWLFWEWRFEIE